MEEVIIPFQVSKGVVVIGSFCAEQESDLYIWIRRFDNEEARVKLYKDVYESDTWKNEIGPKAGTMIEREKHVVTRMNPTPISVIR
jgi:hypothetical protein